MNCFKCNSENIYYSKKNNYYVCEDCGYTFVVEQPKTEIFISYAHDKFAPTVEKVVSSLRNNYHLNVWIDTSDIKSGDDWRKTISNAINNSAIVIAFISTKSIIPSSVCLDELQIAVSHNKSVIPIRFEEVDLPSSINYRQWYDAFDINVEKICDYIIYQIEKEKDYSQQINQLKNLLNPINFNVKLKLLTSKSTITRNWLLSLVDEWIKSSKKFLWIIGNPGTGKSVFAGQLYFKRCYVESIFFSEYDKHKDISIINIIKTIAFQLALRNQDYRDFVTNFDFSSIDNEEALFNDLIVSPLNLLIDGNRPTKIILIDAIDELPSEVSSKLLQLLYENNFPSWIKFAVSSRHNQKYERYYNNHNVYSINLCDKRSKEDIIDYVSAKLDKHIANKNKLQRLSDQIAKKSDGVFLYAVEVVNDILNGHIIEDNELPSGLYALFNNYFDRIVDDLDAYNNYIAPIISLIIYSRVSLSPDFISKVLNINVTNVLHYLNKLQDYFILISSNESTIIKPYHKSIVDWFLELKEYDKYYYNVETTKNIIIQYGINCFRTNILLDNNYTETFYKDIISSSNWNAFSYEEKIRFYLYIIKSAVFNGNIQTEENILNILKTTHFYSIDENMLYLSRRLNYETRYESNNILYTAEKMMELLNKLDSVEQIVTYATEIAAAFFYLGDNYRGLIFMEEIEKKYQSQISTNQKLNTAVKHVYGLLAHDIDKNIKVIESAKNACRGYLETNATYDYLISLINLYDGYMGIGDLGQAYSIIENIDDLITKDTSLQVQDIHYICKANVYLTSGRIMTSLLFYEKGLNLANKIGHTWDYYYGKIWRELALAFYGEKDSISNLVGIYDELNGNEYKYLKSLAGEFLFIALFILHKGNDSTITRIFKDLKETTFPGHRAIIHAVARLLDYQLDYFSIEETIQTFLCCEGIKGGFIIAKAFYDSFAKNDIRFTNWINQFFTPIFEYREKVKESIIHNLDTQFRVKNFNCTNCQAMCCYDGVYISPKEEENILSFIRQHPSFFKDYPNEVILESSWENMISGKKTATKLFSYSNPNYPKHFNNTRCIFATDDGFCQLQKIATQLDLHPWKIKPMSCWMFPLDVDSSGKLIPPPIDKENDPNFIKDKYEGYVTCLECGQFDNNGKLWTDIYYNEIEYYDYIKNKKNNI